MSNQHHINKFWNSFPNPPHQAAVGDSPQRYLKKLNDLCELNLTWPQNHPEGRLERSQLRLLCRDDQVDVLIAYAAVMAWGGGGRGVQLRNYRLSLEDESSRNALTQILNQIRGSEATRESDFEHMQNAANKIKGLGISFYTKLLFFMRKKPDAYILDQYTAKSANLLFDRCKVVLRDDYPDQKTTPDTYEWFCHSVENLGSQCPQGWAAEGNDKGEKVEQAMFDVHGGEWRRHVDSIYPSGAPQARPNEENPAPVPGGPSLPQLVAMEHAQKYNEGEELPGANPRFTQPPPGQPIRVRCSRNSGMDWQYAFGQNQIHAELYIPNKLIARYDDLCRSLHIADHDFGDGIMGNGAKNAQTRSIKITIHQGLNAPQNEWANIARQAVAAMVTLFGRVAENI
jgi:hypothetical protein